MEGNKGVDEQCITSILECAASTLKNAKHHRLCGGVNSNSSSREKQW